MQPTADEVGPSAKSKGNKKGGKNVSRAKRGNRKTYGIQSRFFFILGSVGVVVILINVYVFTGGVLGPAKRPRPIVPGIVWKKDESPHHLSSTRLDKRNNNENSKDGDKDGKERVVQILQEATIQVNTSMRERLPTWEQVTRIVGEHPIIVYNNAESSCAAFRQRVPAVQRMLGSAGMFSTGTNLVTTLLKNNCQIPERVELYGPHASREDHVRAFVLLVVLVQFCFEGFIMLSKANSCFDTSMDCRLTTIFLSLWQGMRWQVPWGKHTPAHYKYEHVAKIAKNVNKEDILPVVTIRNPYQWMKSMCKNPYTAKWNHRRDQCPNLLSSDKNKNNNMNDPNAWNTVSVKYGAGTETYQSLAHLFNDWYNEYLQNASYPWIMIRMEGKR